MIKIIWTLKDETELRLTWNGMAPAEAARLAGPIVRARGQEPETVVAIYDLSESGHV
jgi:hypothetical protein